VLTAHEWLRAAILDGRLTAGSEINQVKVAQRLGMGRAPVREALRMLQREGLVEAPVNQRVRVTAFSPEDLEQLYALRLTTEALAARLSVPKLGSADLEGIATALAAMDGAVADGDTGRWDEFHVGFHRLVVGHAGQRITATLSELREHAERYRAVYVQDPRSYERAGREHAEIAEACRAGAPERAARALAGHIGQTALGTLALVDPLYEPVTVRAALRSQLRPEEA
jgi:DNA-binding GntR family transcriptional regulator